MWDLLRFSIEMLDLVQECSTYASHDMEDTRASHRDADSRLSRQIAIRGRCICRSLFIPETDKADAEMQAFLSDICHGKTRDAENDLDAEVVECPGNDLCSGTHDCGKKLICAERQCGG